MEKKKQFLELDNHSSSCASSNDDEEQLSNLSLPSGRPIAKPSIGRITPPLVLERLKEFLPEIKQANKDLEGKKSSSYSIEQPQKPKKGQKMIELNLGIAPLEDKEITTKDIRPKKSKSNYNPSNNNDSNNNDSGDDLVSKHILEFD